MKSLILRVDTRLIDMSVSNWKDNPPFETKKDWPVTPETLEDLVKSGAKLRYPLSEKYEHLNRI